MFDLKIFAGNVHKFRLRQHMTQTQIARRLFVTPQTVSKWENGTSDPNTSNLIALAKLYGISAEELLKSVEHSAGTAKPNEGSEKTV